MLFTTEWLSELFVDFQGAAGDSIPLEQVTTDSRVETKKSLFIPLVGDNFDGHDYIKQAFDNGAVAAFWDKQKERPHFLPTDFPIFYVTDTLKALQLLASVYRDKVDPIVVGVTGSNGKTTTKDIVSAVVKTSYKTHHTIGNFNNQIGLPLTILSMPANTEMLVLEMGMNHFGEIEQLSNIAKPDYAIITNIGESHIEYLGSREGIAEAKLEILVGMKPNGQIIIDGDEKLLEKIHNNDQVITCGFNANNNVIVSQPKVMQEYTSFHLSDHEEYTISLLGKHNALNASFAITLGERLGINKVEIKKALKSLKLTSMRFELVKGINGVSIINDAYNASPTSMRASIEVVKQMKGFKQKVLVLGDIFELGNYAKELHQSVAEAIDEEIAVLFTYGEHAKEISTTVKEHQKKIISRHFDAREQLLQALQPYLSNDVLLLFKASRGMQFEKLAEKIKLPL
ncbi:UDP-N-acetylmuramoyl-tripeptide--D-alanyl-D-alanine ligase [Virgibacillus byunsanensis]|uniref:UDP-N-acetylmuramoyl-tripeptide--D-alanyl-D-alanine ligase n=1 Tax=Virgibacillus byunsanensis TaxID=570945 RepID=A0ABW3LLE0_9BACI